MKKWGYTLLVAFTIYTYHEGKAQLPLDQNGKITFLEVVQDTVATDTLSKWTEQWLKDRYTQFPVVKDSSGKTFSTTGKFLVYVKEGVFKQIHGAIRYSLKIEIRENRYRYTFTDFVFEYYRQERSDLKYHPTGETKPLEDKEFKGYQKLWDRHKITTNQHVNGMVSSLKAFFGSKKAKKKQQEAVKSGNDW